MKRAQAGTGTVVQSFICTRVIPEHSTSKGLGLGTAPAPGKVCRMPCEAQPGEWARQDGERPQRCLALLACSWATAHSQRSLSKAATRVPKAQAFLCATSTSPGWLGMPHKGYRSKWDSREECKDKELHNLHTAHLHKNFWSFSTTSVSTFSCTKGFTPSLLKSAGLRSQTRLTWRMQQFVESKMSAA